MAELDFEGRTVPVRPGQSLAAALTAAGIGAFRQTASGARRGIFCGIGVCQDCLVEVDGTPGRRACMTPARAGMTVRRQPALPAFAAPPAIPAGALAEPELLVIGGGAAGLAAATEAARAGAAVTLLDERRVPGGQYYKQAAEAPPLDRQQAEGAALLDRARAAGVRIETGVEVWGAFDGPLILAARDGAPLAFRPRALVVATGAYERPLMVPGWTLPGVMTTGAAQTLWRSYRTLPGRRIAVAGSGPLNLQVALELGRGGAEIVLVAESAGSPLARPALLGLALAGPRLAATGALMAARLGRRLLRGHRLERIEPAEGGLAVTVAGPRGRTVAVDAVLMNGGFQPQNEILRLLGAETEPDAAMGQLRVRRDADMATSVAMVWAAGDCCGLGGAPAALEEGRIAGRAAARALGHRAPADPDAARRLARHRRFQDALWALHDPAPQGLGTLPPETLICRCEEVTKAALDAALAEGAGDIGAVKRATRIGMGPCQGRYCGPALARLLATRAGVAADEMQHFAPRVPVKPVSVATVQAAEALLRLED